MHISPGLFLLVNLALAALEAVEASSLSDIDEIQKRTRCYSDLGIGSDQEQKNYCSTSGNQTPIGRPPTFPFSQQSSSPMSILGNPNSKLTAPYYREFLSQLLSPTGNEAMSQGAPSAYLASFDFDTSMRQPGNLFSYKVPERSFAPTTTEMMTLGDNDGYDTFGFDRVSNAVFVSYRNSGSGGEAHNSSTGSGCAFSGENSIRSNSPLSSDRDIQQQPNPNVSLSQEAIAELNKSVAQEENAYEPDDDEDRADLKEGSSTPKPSYKEVLGMKSSSDSKTAGKVPIAPTQNTLELGSERKSASRSRTKEYLKKSGNNSEDSKAKKSSRVCSITQQIQQNQELKPLELMSVNYSPKFDPQMTMSNPSFSSKANTPTINSRRPMVTPNEVFSALVAAVTVGSSSGKHQQQHSVSESDSVNLGNPLIQASQSVLKPELKREGEQKGMVAREHKQQQQRSHPNSQQQKSQPIPIPPNHQQSQQQPQPHPQQLRPPRLHTYFQWGNMFRLPKHAAPPPEMNQNRFQFPRNEHTSKGFLKSLKLFRKMLKYYKDEKIRDVLFEDFEPILNYVGGRTGEEVDTSDPKRSRKYSLTDSQPIKIFNTPPVRTWIPVRCDAIGFDLKVVSAGVGHSEKNVKSEVSIVYDANREARERAKEAAAGGRKSSEPERERVTYISKEYYDMEYFLNEYNFFQFAHLPYLPKPLCVEYDPHPKIVMEHIPGERVHDTLYRLGQALRNKYPDEKELREEKMKTTLIKILAKILVTVKYIHSIGFIHADIKPENIMYDTKTGRVVMLDFNLTVSAPYVFAGRGTATTVAPELNGLLQGPVHFGIDWWAYGSTAARIISSGFAGILFDPEKERPIIERYFNYVPFMYIKGQNKYKMTPIPEFFPPAMRSFLYPFFNPDPSLRVFSEHNAYNWIRSHPLFTVITDWTKYEKLVMGSFFEATPMQIGLMAFSSRPVLLLPISRLHKIFNGISNLLYLGTSATTRDGTLANVADSGDEDEDDEEEEEEEEDSEEDYSEEADEETVGNRRAAEDKEVFAFEE